MKKLLIIAMIVIGGLVTANAQDYETAIGLRGGLSNGITLKHFLTQETAVEGILAIRWGGFLATGLYEFERYMNTPGLSWYYGAGVHVGFFNADAYNVPWTDELEKVVVLGVDGIIGIEYTFENIPINISLDWKPALNLVGHTGLWGDEAAISLRYVLR